MPIYRVRREETETETTTTVSYATFAVDALDDPNKAFHRLKRDGDLKWERAYHEDDNDYDTDEEFDAPEMIADDESAEPPIRGKPADFGLMQAALV